MTRPVLPSALLALAFGVLSSAVHAQALTIASGSVRRGEPVELPVRFTAGSIPVVGFNLRVVYDRSRFDAPTCTGHAGASCVVNHAQGLVSLIHVDWNLAPLASADYATIRFPAAASALRGTTLLGARFIDFAGPSGNAVDGTIYTGQVAIR